MICLHVDRSTKSPGTVCRRTHSPLYLHGIYRARKIGHIDPIGSLRFRIIDRNAIDRHINPRRIRASNSDSGIPDSRTRIGSSYDRWSKI